MKKIISILLAALMCAGIMGVTAGAAEYSLGDANMDEWVDNLDAALLLKYDAGLIDLEEGALAVSDTNYDGAVDNLDASLILKYDAGLMYDFCEEHVWVDATCTDAKYCDYCYLTVGEALGHNMVEGACTNEGCDYTDAKQQAFDALRDYIVANGENEEGSYYLYKTTDDDVLAMFVYTDEYPDAISLALVAETETAGAMLVFEYTSLNNEQTAVYIYSDEETYEMAWALVDITTFSKTSPEFVEFDGSMTNDSEGALKSTQEGLAILLDEFAALLEESDLGYTLADLGFVAY